MIRVLHIVDYWRGGGIEKLLEVTLPELRQTGIEVALLYLNDDTSSLDGLRQAQIPNQCMRPLDPIGFRSFRRTPAEKRRDIATAVNYIGKVGANLMHAHQHTSYLFTAELHEATGLAYLVTDHMANAAWQTDRSIRGRFNRRMLFSSYKKAERVICVSKASQASLQESMGLANVKCEVLYNAIGEVFWQPRAAERGPGFDVLMCGRLARQKNYFFALDVFRELSSRFHGLRVGIIGTGPLEMELSAGIQERGLAAEVTMLGGKSSEEVRDLMDDSQCFFMPSLREGLPIAALEALARGMPAVFSDALPFKLDLAQFGGVQIVDTSSIHPSVQALLASIGSVREERPRLRSFFGIDSHIHRLSRIYKEVEDSRRLRPSPR